MHSSAALLSIWNMHSLDTTHVCCSPCSMTLRQQALYLPAVLLSVLNICCLHICIHLYLKFMLSCLLQYDPQASGVIDYQALMKELLHSDYYALYLGSVDNTQNTLDATSTYNMITNLKTQFAAQGHKLQQVSMQFTCD